MLNVTVGSEGQTLPAPVGVCQYHPFFPAEKTILCEKGVGCDEKVEGARVKRLFVCERARPYQDNVEVERYCERPRKG